MANKYDYTYVVQCNYGYGDGWEDLTASIISSEAKADLKAYRVEEAMGVYRMVQRRMPKDSK